MGTTADINGISIQLVDKHNKAIEPPIFGPHAHLHGIPRSQALETTALAAGEQLGSEHWMTLLAVADTKERLDAIVNTSAAAQGSCNTSCASHRVLVEIHVGNRRETLEGRSVIASGPFVQLNPPKVNVTHVKVLPANTILTERHAAAREFKGVSPFSADGIKAAAASLIMAETTAATEKAEAEAAAATVAFTAKAAAKATAKAAGVP